MPNPKRKHSHARSAKRRTHYTTDLPEITPNKQVGSDVPFHLRHHASADGYYKGRKLPGFK
ncbi:MAG TPA: 50S ribosomal protein L32 [Fimbriimonadaceae bacterium]|nr:50S ribosomal protein L32 [Fimbriimonadaceae bacterium]